MEDGPAKRTRSVTSVDKGSTYSHYLENFSDSDSDHFKTPVNTPTRNKHKSNKGRTPSGQILTGSVKDIWNFFLQQSEINGDYGSEVSQENLEQNSHCRVVNCDNTLLCEASGAINRMCINTELGANHDESTQVLSVNAIDALSSSNHLSNCNPSIMEEIGISVKSKKYVRLQDQRKQELKYRQARDAKTQKARSKQEKEKSEEILGQDDTQNSDHTKEVKSANSMDVKLVYEMFKELKSEISSNKIPDGDDRITNVEQRQDKIIDMIYDIKEELFVTQMKMSC